MESKGEIVIYEGADGQASIDVKLENDSVWLNLLQISSVFGKDKSVISRHLRNIYADGEFLIFSPFST